MLAISHSFCKLFTGRFFRRFRRNWAVPSRNHAIKIERKGAKLQRRKEKRPEWSPSQRSRFGDSDWKCLFLLRDFAALSHGIELPCPAVWTRLSRSAHLSFWVTIECIRARAPSPSASGAGEVALPPRGGNGGSNWFNSVQFGSIRFGFRRGSSLFGALPGPDYSPRPMI